MRKALVSQIRGPTLVAHCASRVNASRRRRNTESTRARVKHTRSDQSHTGNVRNVLSFDAMTNNKRQFWSSQGINASPRLVEEYPSLVFRNHNGVCGDARQRRTHPTSGCAFHATSRERISTPRVSTPCSAQQEQSPFRFANPRA